MGSRPAVAAIFLSTGFMFGTWAARLPAVKAELDLSDAGLAVALFTLEGGALLGLPLGGRLVNRHGSRHTLRWALPLFAAMLPCLALAPSLPALAAGTAIFATANSVVDVAMNAQGLALQVRSGQSQLSRLHAMHPIGGVLGAAVGALAATAGIGLLPHFALTAATVVFASWWVTPRLLTAHGHHSGMPWSRPLILAGVLACCLTFAEGAATNWSAVHLRESLGASAGVAGAAVTVFLLTMAAGRLVGDRLVSRFGAVAVFRIAAVTGGLGLAAGLATQSVAGGLVGFAFLGLGLSVTMPIAISVAGESGGGSTAHAVATVSAMAYAGSFVAAPVIGLVATATNLTVALLLPAALVVALAPLAGQMARSRSAQ